MRAFIASYHSEDKAHEMIDWYFERFPINDEEIIHEMSVDHINGSWRVGILIDRKQYELDL